MKFSLFRRKKQQNEENVSEKSDNQSQVEQLVEQMEREPIKVEKEKIDIHDDRARLDYLGRMYEAILEARHQCNDIKYEYGQVTSYLKDIQLLDQAPMEEKVNLLTAAKRIVELTAERYKLQKQKYNITDAQKRAMENYENIVFDDIQKLTECEEYQVKIKNDLRQLSSEKNLLLADKKDIIRRQHF